MSYEVECGECHETILIEDLGVEVACPHCESTLMLSEDDVTEMEPIKTAEPANDESAEESNESTDNEETITPEEVTAEAEEPSAPADSTPNFNFLHQAHGDSNESVIDDEADDTPAFSIKTGSSLSAVAIRPKTESNSSAPQVSTDDDVSTDDKADDEHETTASPVEQANVKPASVRSTRRAGIDPEKLLKFLISYAIFVTVVMLYLLFSFYTAKPHQLESLPDLRPPEDGEFMHYRENASLAPGHSLQIGETQRFGSIKVTPLKVTRAPLKFAHFQTRASGDVPPTEPVLKLWLKIENVSDDQVFPPLDNELIQIREYDRENIKQVYANNWVCTADVLSERTGRVLMYEHPATSEYDIAGMITKPLKPGESIETFLPSQEEGLKQLTGNLVWRFQIRKGFNPQSMNGVTTLVEVLFNSDEIKKGA